MIKPLQMKRLIQESEEQEDGGQKKKLQRECENNMWPSCQVWSTFRYIREKNQNTTSGQLWMALAPQFGGVGGVVNYSESVMWHLI